MSINFTTEQKQIFEFVQKGDRHGIIDAVAGAGKTTTIMECAKFVGDPGDVLFCAFNNSIAAEIRRKFVKKGMSRVTVKTIHALGRQMLQTNNRAGRPIKLENGKYRQLLHSKEMQQKLKPLYDQLISINGFNPNFTYQDRQKFAIKNLLYRVNSRLLAVNQKFRATLTKNTETDFEALVRHFGIFNSIALRKKNFEKELKLYFECHELLLAAGNLMAERSMIIDFTDMLYLPYHWKLSPATKYGFLFIDECQDLSKAQFAVAAKYGKKGGRILAVGDPRQSIYGFTGADIDSFNRVKRFTKAQELPLTICFRCPQKVIALAKPIRSDIAGLKKELGKVETIAFDDVVSLAKPGDLIISRLKAPLLILIFTFIDKNIRVSIHEDEVAEVINELKSVFKQNELNQRIESFSDGFERLRITVFNRWSWIISKNAERIVDSAERSLYIDRETAYLNSKLDFLHKKYEQWKAECPTVLAILRKIKDYISSKDHPVKLSTIHRAKGLEEDRVFILNYDELPLARPEQRDWEKEQELNLKYVAVTRAKRELFLVESAKLEEVAEEESLFDDLPFS